MVKYTLKRKKTHNNKTKQKKQTKKDHNSQTTNQIKSVNGMKGKVRKEKNYCPHLKLKNALLKITQKVIKGTGNWTLILDIQYYPLILKAILFLLKYCSEDGI